MVQKVNAARQWPVGAASQKMRSGIGSQSVSKNSPGLLAALKYRSWGWSVVPFATSGQKRPAVEWKPLQSQRLSVDDLRQLWSERPWLNVGAVTGSVSGISVVDFDGPHAFALLTDRGITIPKTRAHRSPHGYHLFYKYNPLIPTDSKLLEADCDCQKPCAVDIRSDAGVIMLPPSVFDGKPYRVVADVEIAEWPDPPVELRGKLKKVREPRPPAPRMFNGTSPYQRIKSAVTVTEVAAMLGVELRPSGGVERGLCPLHTERTASFTIWPDQESWWCFGCGRGSDVIDLLRESGRLREFLEAAR